jgi:hypothetical protein
MKKIRMLGMMMAVLALAGCSGMGFKFFEAKPAPTTTQALANAEAVPTRSNRHATDPGQIKINDGNGEVVIQTVDFRPGISSATVERLAKQFGCTGSLGAGLIAEKGPVEVYRMKCDNGTIFMAQCELRQCRPMR